jgi:protein-tyrosine phosphatase
VVESLVDAGCLMQATAGSLVGTFGPQVQAAVEQMLTRGLIHFLATDAHGAQSRRPLMRRSFDRVAELVGLDAAHELCYHNPARVVANGPVQKGRRPVRRTMLARWFAPRKAG